MQDTNYAHETSKTQTLTRHGVRGTAPAENFSAGAGFFGRRGFLGWLAALPLALSGWCMPRSMSEKLAGWEGKQFALADADGWTRHCGLSRDRDRQSMLKMSTDYVDGSKYYLIVRDTWNSNSCHRVDITRADAVAFLEANLEFENSPHLLGRII